MIFYAGGARHCVSSEGIWQSEVMMSKMSPSAQLLSPTRWPSRQMANSVQVSAIGMKCSPVGGHSSIDGGGISSHSTFSGKSHWLVAGLNSKSPEHCSSAIGSRFMQITYREQSVRSGTKVGTFGLRLFGHFLSSQATLASKSHCRPTGSNICPSPHSCRNPRLLMQRVYIRHSSSMGTRTNPAPVVSSSQIKQITFHGWSHFCSGSLKLNPIGQVPGTGISRTHVKNASQAVKSFTNVPSGTPTHGFWALITRKTLPTSTKKITKKSPIPVCQFFVTTRFVWASQTLCSGNGTRSTFNNSDHCVEPGDRFDKQHNKTVTSKSNLWHPRRQPQQGGGNSAIITDFNIYEQRWNSCKSVQQICSAAIIQVHTISDMISPWFGCQKGVLSAYWRQ